MLRFLKRAALASLVLTGSVGAAFAQQVAVGREATAAEIQAWDIAVRPDGKGLPVGRGTAAKGEDIFQTQCATCHGEFGEGKGRWPELAGGHGTLKADRPFKTIGSYWPYATTVFDYVKRAMPFGNAQSLSNDDVYAVTAYLLSLNDVIKDQNFELNEKTLAAVKMPNAEGFYDDDREVSEKHFWGRVPCMKDCRKGAAAVTGRAMAVDVTPAQKAGPKVD